MLYVGRDTNMDSKLVWVWRAGKAPRLQPPTRSEGCAEHPRDRWTPVKLRTRFLPETETRQTGFGMKLNITLAILFGNKTVA